MEIRLLGPLEVIDDHGRRVAIRMQRPRAVLAILALHLERPVTVVELVQALWGAEPPQTAKGSVHVFIHELRKAMGAGLVQTHGISYKLRLPPDQVDVGRFRRLVDEAHAAHGHGALEEAWEGFGRALELWRGTALADFVTEPFARVERPRLEERRLAAVETQMRVGLALGRHAELAGELEALVAEHPLREGLWELLMLARYRAARQAGALEAYQRARQQLVEHGLEPGQRLQELQRAILTQDPALDLQRPKTALFRPQPQTQSSAQPRSSLPGSGTPPAAPTPAVAGAVIREERRTVTVLVVGAGSGLRGDPEDVRAQLSQVTQQVQGLVSRYGGVVRQGAMGRLLVVFGALRSHEDDAERAVRAALDLRAHVQTTGPVRIGVATGEAVVTRTEAERLAPEAAPGLLVSVDGEVTSGAALLEASAPPGSVIVGSRTYWATGRAITYCPAPSVAGHGALGEVPAWEALAPRARTGAYRLTLGDPISRPLVERERELAILQGVLSRFLRDRQPQLLTVVSEPGLGKTRLVAELGRLMDQAQELVAWRAGRSVAYGAGSLGALAEVVKAHVGILDTDPPDVVGDKLGHAVAEVIGDAGEVAWVTEQLRALTGPTPPQEEAKAQPVERFGAWMRFLAATAVRRPMVVVLEDLHWAEDPLVDFIDFLVEQVESVPLLVVCTARLEFLDRHPRWGGGKPNSFTLALSPLSPAGTEQLLDALLGDMEPGEDARKALLTASGGNPLYVEEYVRMLTEGLAGAAVLTTSDGAASVPATIQQLIAARLDTLAPADKQLLQDAAVIGEIGWVGALAAVSGQDRSQVQEGLQRLERREFLRRLRASSVAGETEYAFRHTLIREVAYQQLLRAARAEKHRLAARWIESLNPNAEDRVELLSYHYSQALELTGMLGRPDGELIRRTREAARIAGDRATGLSAFTSAVRHYQRALDLWPGEDPSRPELLVRLGEAMVVSRGDSTPLLQARDVARSAGREDLAIEADLLLRNLARAPHGLEGRPREHTALDPPGTKPRPLEEQTNHPDGQVAAAALGSHATDLLVASRHAEALAIAEDLVAHARALRLPEYEGYGLALAGDARIRSGDLSGKASFAEGIQLMEARRFPMRIWAYFGHARSLWIHGDLQGCAVALQQGRGAIGTAATVTAWFDVLNAGLDYVAGRWDTALAAIDAALASDRVRKERFPTSWSLILRARIRLARDDPDGALADAASALETASDVRLQQAVRAVLGRALLAAKDRAAAAECAAQLLADQHQHPERAAVTPDLVWLLSDLGETQAETLPVNLSPTRWHLAAQAFRAGQHHEAAELFDLIGSRVDAAQTRLRAARALDTAGRRAEALAILDLASVVFQEADATIELSAAEAIRRGASDLSR